MQGPVGTLSRSRARSAGIVGELGPRPEALRVWAWGGRGRRRDPGRGPPARTLSGSGSWTRRCTGPGRVGGIGRKGSAYIRPGRSPGCRWRSSTPLLDDNKGGFLELGTVLCGAELRRHPRFAPWVYRAARSAPRGPGACVTRPLGSGSGRCMRAATACWDPQDARHAGPTRDRRPARGRPETSALPAVERLMRSMGLHAHTTRQVAQDEPARAQGTSGPGRLTLQRLQAERAVGGRHCPASGMCPPPIVRILGGWVVRLPSPADGILAPGHRVADHPPARAPP